MTTTTTSSSRPAICGGTPVFNSPVSLAWPIPHDATAKAVGELYRSGQWSWNGPWEQRAAGLLGKVHTARHAMLLANGTVTLEIALHALGIGPGDEVIMPSFTWLATAMAALYVGATPVFVDVEPGTLCLDVALAEAAITPKTKAIIPVHLYGGMTDMDAVMALATKHGLKVVEDCAHAQGGMWDGRGLGSIGDAGSFSFQQSKTISAGEGGALITNNDDLAERLYRAKHIGYAPDAIQGKASQGPPRGLVCHNYRATEFQGVVICPQLEELEALTVRRNATADTLTALLETIPGLEVQKRGRKADTGRQSYYAMIVKFDPEAWAGVTKDRLIAAIEAEGLGARSTYGPVHRHLLWNVPENQYRIHGGWRDSLGENCRVTEEIGTQRSISLAHQFLDLPEDQIHKVAEIFHKLHQNADSLRA